MKSHERNGNRSHEYHRGPGMWEVCVPSPHFLFVPSEGMQRILRPWRTVETVERAWGEESYSRPLCKWDVQFYFVKFLHVEVYLSEQYLLPQLHRWSPILFWNVGVICTSCVGVPTKTETERMPFLKMCLNFNILSSMSRPCIKKIWI